MNGKGRKVEGKDEIKESLDNPAPNLKIQENLQGSLVHQRPVS